MGNVCGARPIATCEACDDPTFRGLKMGSRSCAYAALLERMDELKLPHLTAASLLAGLNTQKTWDVYLFFPEWPGPVTAACVSRLMDQFRACCREWLSKLRGYNGFTTQAIRVRIFGFVFCEGVETDATFDKKYGAYPIVRKWTDTSEASPWIISANTPSRNMYDPKLDLHSIQVKGNRTTTGASFSPASWDGYRHPEGCVGYQTRFWHGTKGWNATAQRHYLRVAGVLEDPATGDFGTRLNVLKHEMGHCFFLDDLYDKKKYPAPLPRCNCDVAELCGVGPEDTIMHGGPAITAFDHAQLRHVWNASVRNA